MIKAETVSMVSFIEPAGRPWYAGLHKCEFQLMTGCGQ